MIRFQIKLLKKDNTTNRYNNVWDQKSQMHQNLNSKSNELQSEEQFFSVYSNCTQFIVLILINSTIKSINETLCVFDPSHYYT